MSVLTDYPTCGEHSGFTAEIIMFESAAPVTSGGESNAQDTLSSKTHLA